MVAVEDHSRAGSARTLRHLKRALHHVGVEPLVHRPPHDAAVERIEHHRQVQPTLKGAMPRGGGDPEAVVSVMGEDALHVILSQLVKTAASAPSLAVMHALKALGAHQAHHAMTRGAQLGLLSKLGVNAPDTVRAAATLEDRLDDITECGVGDVTLGCRPRPPGVIAAPRDLQEPG